MGTEVVTVENTVFSMAWLPGKCVLGWWWSLVLDRYM